MSGHGSREWQTVMGATLGPLVLLCKLHVPCRSWIVNCHKWKMEHRDGDWASLKGSALEEESPKLQPLYKLTGRIVLQEGSALDGKEWGSSVLEEGLDPGVGTAAPWRVGQGWWQHPYTPC